MSKVFAIDFVRQVIYQTLLQEHLNNPKFVGGVNDLSLVSFYEHLETDSEVDRFVEAVRDLNDQQNRTHLLMNGVIVSPTNPTITNLNQSLIIPLDFSISFRTTLAYRDSALETLHNAIYKLKGRKFDIAELDNGKLFMVGTMANNVNGSPLVRNGDYIGYIGYPTTLDSWINATTYGLINMGLVFDNRENGAYKNGSYFYFGSYGKLKVAYYNGNEWNEIVDNYEDYPNIIFPPEHNSFERYCLSISFDSESCSEPRTLNAEDYCDIRFGGSATLVGENVMLGNQLTKLGIRRLKVITSDNVSGDITFPEGHSWLEPLEMPSGNNADTMLNQLTSNNFVNNSHTNNISITNQYTFIIDENITLLKELFKYARYGIQNYITPNIIYEIKEVFSKWGYVEINTFNAKIVESIDIENTESDTLTITLPMQIQGDNN